MRRRRDGLSPLPGAGWAVLVLVMVLIPSPVAYAHVLSARSRNSLDPIELLEAGLPIALAATLYIRGMLVYWSHAMRGRRETLLRAAAFGSGLLVLIVALFSPLDTWGTELFSLHMVQHELLMLVAAPLLVLGRPLPMFLWAFWPSARDTVSAVTRTPIVRRTWRFLMTAGIAWLFHALALWVWHVPRFFDAVLQSRLVHDLQHLTFFVSALVFWAALFEERRHDSRGAAVLYLFTTTVHTSVLGALITFARQPWYSACLQSTHHWGLSALEDQQLGGLIMWVPGSLVYVGTALLLLARWIMASERSAAGANGRAGVHGQR